MTLAEAFALAQRLPPEKQAEVADFIDFLVARSGAASDVPEQTLVDLHQPFFGMWADREDMKDSVEYVRRLRQSEWEGRHRGAD